MNAFLLDHLHTDSLHEQKYKPAPGRREKERGMNIKSGNATIKVLVHFSPFSDDAMDHLELTGFSGCSLKEANDLFSSVRAECGSSQAKWAAKFAQSAECFTGLESQIPSTLTRPTSTTPTPAAATLFRHGFDHSDIALLNDADIQECLFAIPSSEQPIRPAVPTKTGAKAREEHYVNNIKDLIAAIESTMPGEKS